MNKPVNPLWVSLAVATYGYSINIDAASGCKFTTYFRL